MTPLTADSLASAMTMLAVVGQGVLAHRKGKEGKKENHEALNAINVSIAELKAHVIGPDGENGLRGDVRELKADVKGILERERDTVPAVVEPTPRKRRRA